MGSNQRQLTRIIGLIIADENGTFSMVTLLEEIAKIIDDDCDRRLAEITPSLKELIEMANNSGAPEYMRYEDFRRDELGLGE